MGIQKRERMPIAKYNAGICGVKGNKRSWAPIINNSNNKAKNSPKKGKRR